MLMFIIKQDQWANYYLTGLAQKPPARVVDNAPENLLLTRVPVDHLTRHFEGLNQ